MRGDVIAELYLLPTKEGGRRGPTPDGYFGCILQVHGRQHDCRVLESKGIAPGERATKELKFLNREAALAGVEVGDTFELWEMGVIGSGVITQILEPSPS